MPISKFNTTLTKSILGLFLSTSKRSTGTQIILLSTFGLNLSILQTLHTIAESLNGETVGVSLSGLSKIVLFTRPKLSNTSITLGRILNSLNLGELSINLINLSLETLRKGIGLSSRTNEIKERIGILDRTSFGQNFQTSSIRQLSLSLNILSLNNLHSRTLQTLKTTLNSGTGVILIRTTGRNRTGIRSRSITLSSTHRLKNRTFNKRVNSSSLISGTLSDGRLEFIVRPLGIITILLPLHFSVITLVLQLPLIHFFLPLTILTVHITTGSGRNAGTQKGTGTGNNTTNSNRVHKLIGISVFKTRLVLLGHTIRNLISNSDSTFETVQTGFDGGVNRSRAILIVNRITEFTTTKRKTTLTHRTNLVRKRLNT